MLVTDPRASMGALRADGWLLTSVLLVAVCFSGLACLAGADDSEVVNATEAIKGVSDKEGSFADMIDRALEKEFPDNEQSGGGLCRSEFSVSFFYSTDGFADVWRCDLGGKVDQSTNDFIYPVETDPGGFNNSVAENQAVLETVARVTTKKNETKEEKSFQFHDVFNLDNENRVEDIPTLIDRKDNVFIISNPKSKYPVLQLDLRLISDLVVVIVSATCGGIAFACAGQPVITGYLLAGSIIGPGGFRFISEMVQVETVAQFGVIFLLFALGLEFSISKIRVVRAVAIGGGFLQILLFMCLCGVIALLCGGKTSEGIFVGAFLSMSSTAVVSFHLLPTNMACFIVQSFEFLLHPFHVSKHIDENSSDENILVELCIAQVLKFLMERNTISALHGQVTVGTLILQDCAVGLLFALLPILGGSSGIFQGLMSVTKSLIMLFTFLAILSILSRTAVPWFLKLMISLSTQTNELYQLASVAFCLLVAWGSDKLGLSLELGSFAAGVMISTTDLAQHTLEQIEPIRNFFAALFLASIGMLIHVQFLWNHVDILLAAVILVIIVKTIVMTLVVKGFGYNNKTSLLVGLSLAQIGEFAFVLLSRASNLHLVEVVWIFPFRILNLVCAQSSLLKNGKKLACVSMSKFIVVVLQNGNFSCTVLQGKLYLLLLGTTALSLVTTPLLFKFIPAIIHLGVLLRWFAPDSIELGHKGDSLRSDSANKRMTSIIQGSHDS
ncbi:hypothetical protein ZIOFF_042563 [Zingiber officinale]|uniref:Cation/H+ exchanger transmembrane domain-containing protein n=1 Tax=Zingiber officinale TaxID=94328 RepID=A0A8J5KVL2_ZINOF|nr:hypothetical protein ZIOFF_042563 [Zingiber officinale]